MGIDMTGYKMIYQDKVYNCISLMVYWEDGKIHNLEVFYINEDSRVAFIRDDALKIQFITK